MAYLSLKQASGSALGVFLGIAGPAITMGFGLPRRDQFSGWINNRIGNERRSTILSTIGVFAALLLFPLKNIAGWYADESYSGLMFLIGITLVVWITLTNLIWLFIKRR
jgi:hypothetical protein